MQRQRAVSERRQIQKPNYAYNFLLNCIPSTSTNKVPMLELVAYSIQVVQ